MTAKVLSIGIVNLVIAASVVCMAGGCQRGPGKTTGDDIDAVENGAVEDGDVEAADTEVTVAEDAVAAESGPPRVAVDANVVRAIAAEREQLNETVWSDEVKAQKYEEPFVDLWDTMRSSEDQIGDLANFAFSELTLGLPGEATRHDHEIDAFRCDDGTRTFDSEQWKSWLSEWKESGLRIIQTEWHHSRFEPDPDTPRSIVSFVLDAMNAAENTYYTVKGKLAVNWEPRASATDPPLAGKIEVTDVTVLRRHAAPLFREAAVLDSQLASRSPLIATDVDGDGLSEVVSPAENRLFWNRGDFRFETAQLFEFPLEGPSLAGVLTDFTGDGRPDFLGSSPGHGVFLYTAGDSGQFPERPRTVFTSEDLVEPTVITAGDIDADGDLDVWIGQYKSPYSGGQMPTPYYDANDGYPAYLLRNEGDGVFADITEASGLTGKRNRRTYSASLVDLDDDLDLDLIVVSDFAGVDLYTNDGKGNFSDATDQKIDNRHAFGMSLSVADYNLDSKLDFFMTGMSSTTALRLHQMGLGRETFQEHQSHRPEMGYGNRLFLAEGEGLVQAPFNDQVARTGWSWGTTSFDFDNDGDRDLFVANGHQSRSTAKDYCTDFWCHDIYSGSSKSDPELGAFFKITSTLNFQQKGISWNGFEHNKLLMNEDGRGFLGIAFLAGVASEFDSRNVISDDFDGDGRVDLLVLYREPVNRSPSVHLLQNQNESAANWIGVRLDGELRSGLGARVTVKTPDRTHVAAVVSGDSYVSQHAPVLHFGLGSATEVEDLEIHWPDGASVKIPSPEINRYHRIRADDINASSATASR